MSTESLFGPTVVLGRERRGDRFGTLRIDTGGTLGKNNY